MEKIDFRRDQKELYKPGVKLASKVVVPRMKFLSIKGTGHPQSGEYHSVFPAVYGIAYGLKFANKENPETPDYVVPPLETLWWMAGGKSFEEAEWSDWRWEVLVRVPDFISIDDFKRMKEQIKAKKDAPEKIEEVEWKEWEEGLCVQVLHVGPYDQVGASIMKMKELAESEGLTYHGVHHEIYLSDPRRTAPEKLKTVLRQPVK